MLKDKEKVQIQEDTIHLISGIFSFFIFLFWFNSFDLAKIKGYPFYTYLIATQIYMFILNWPIKNIKNIYNTYCYLILNLLGKIFINLFFAFFCFCSYERINLLMAKIQEDEVYLAGRIVSFFSFFIFLYLLVRFNVGWDIKGNILLVCFAFTRSTPFFHDFFSEKVENFKNSYYFLCLHLIESIGFNFLFVSIISDFF